jgi:hypothetical protein
MVESYTRRSNREFQRLDRFKEEINTSYPEYIALVSRCMQIAEYPRGR